MQTKQLNLTSQIKFLEAAEGESADSVSRFAMVAYNGGAMNVEGWDQPVVVDLAGMEVEHQQNPALYDHDRNRIVGHTTQVANDGESVKINGLVSGENEEAKQVQAMGRRDFPWQASLGLSVPKDRMQAIKRGRTVSVNGRNIHGPATIARKSRFREVSFTPWGADSTTRATITASQKHEDHAMQIQNLITALGLELTDSQRTELEPLLLKAAGGEELTNDERQLLATLKRPEPEPEPEPPVPGLPDVGQQIRLQAAEAQRTVATLQTKFADFPELAAKALEEDWDEGRQEAELKSAKLERLQAERVGNGIESFNTSVNGSVNEVDVAAAALAISAGCDPEFLMKPDRDAVDVHDRIEINATIKPIDEQTIDLALSHYGNQFGPGQMLIFLARKEGKFNGFTNTSNEKALRAGFSTVNMPTVFGDTMNRTLLAAYRAQPTTWRLFARAATVRDFRQVTRVRAFGTGHYEALGPGGNIGHGNMTEETYTNKAETKAQINMLPRELFVNDDLGAFSQIGTDMARYGALAPEIEVYNALLANTGNFFGAGNGNLLAASPTTFDLAGLGALQTLFRKQTTNNRKDSRRNKPGATPSIVPTVLLVPVELEVEAWNLTNSTWVNSGTADRQPTANWARSRYAVASSPYLSDTNVNGNANGTSYYLFADPNDVAAIEVAFLNGRQRPTIESVVPEADTLGMGMRGYIDFGVALQDYRAAARADETA